MPAVYVYRSTEVQEYGCKLNSIRWTIYRPRGLVIKVAPETSAQEEGSWGSEEEGSWGRISLFIDQVGQVSHTKHSLYCLHSCPRRSLGSVTHHSGAEISVSEDQP